MSDTRDYIAQANHLIFSAIEARKNGDTVMANIMLKCAAALYRVGGEPKEAEVAESMVIKV